MSEQTATTRKSYHVSVPSVDVTIFIRLGADPEMRYTPNGNAVLDVRGVASRRYQKDGEWMEQASWYKAAVWKEAAERLAARNLHKGDIVSITFNPADAKAEPFTGRDGTAMASLSISFGNVKVFAQDADAVATEAPAEATPEDEIPF